MDFFGCCKDLSKLINVFLMSCYMDLSKLLRGFVKVVLYISRPLPSKTKLKCDGLMIELS